MSETARAAADEIFARLKTKDVSEPAECIIARHFAPTLARLQELEQANVKLAKAFNEQACDECGRHHPYCTCYADLEQRLAAAAQWVEKALDLASDLRGYTRDWDWKYGEYWDGEYAEIEAALERYKKRVSDQPQQEA